MSRRPYPEDLPPKVIEALNVFSDEELKSLRAFWGKEGFLGVGFIGPGNVQTEFADPEKADAIGILNEQMLNELSNTPSHQNFEETIFNAMRKSWGWGRWKFPEDIPDYRWRED